MYFITAKHRQILPDSFVIVMTNSKVPLNKHAVLNRPIKHASKTRPAIASSVSVKVENVDISFSDIHEDAIS